MAPWLDCEPCHLLPDGGDQPADPPSGQLNIVANSRQLGPPGTLPAYRLSNSARHGRTAANIVPVWLPSRRPHPHYWNRAYPVRLPLPIIPCVNDRDVSLRWIRAKRVSKKGNRRLVGVVSDRSSRCITKFRWSRTTLRSPCSVGVAGSTNQRSFTPPIVGATPGRYVAGRDDALIPGSNRPLSWPTPPASRRRRHRPRSPVADGIYPATAAMLTERRLDPEYRRDAPPCQQQPQSIYHDMAFPSVHLLASVVASGPPFSPVFTD